MSTETDNDVHITISYGTTDTTVIEVADGELVHTEVPAPDPAA